MNGRRGVALLLETVVGLGLFAVAIIIFFGIFTTVGRSAAQARNHSVALHLARELMERERSKDYAAVDDVGLAVVPVSATMNGVDTTMQYNTEVYVNEEVAGERKNVLVTVSWAEGAVRREVQLETFKVSF